RPMYCEIAVSTAEFKKVFLVPNEPIMRTGKIAKPVTRQPTKIDGREFLLMAQNLHSARGYGPSLQETIEFAGRHRIARWWAREQHKGLPEELRRERGGKGLTRHLNKRAQANNRN